MEKEIKIFIKKSIFFILIFLIIFFTLNKFYVDEIENKKQIFNNENLFQEYKHNIINNTIDYAFFGDSHVKNSFYAESINNSLFFGSIYLK